MKKALILVMAAFGLAAWVVLMFRNPEAVSNSAAQPWPGGMGALKATETRWPTLKANEASLQLTTLAKALPKSEELDKFVEREIARADLSIGEPPTVSDVSAIRELLLRDAIVWESRAEFDSVEVGERRTMQMTMARSLVASALAKARKQDPAAWNDLHAAWKLAQSLDAHPQMMAQTAALTITRLINSVAWKLPLPAPAWFGELQSRDNVQILLEAFQYQAASYTKSGIGWFPTKSLASSVDHDRKIAEDLFNDKRCDVNAPMNDLGTDLSSVWRRAFRYRAEREATANVLRAREGKPIETTSRCSDGGWSFDGTILKFNREIATSPPDTPMPLVLRLKP
jgi:hypothetical protein